MHTGGDGVGPDPILLYVETSFTEIAVASEPTTLRECVDLRDHALTTGVAFLLEVNGPCAESDVQLWLDDLRLEPDPDCG